MTASRRTLLMAAACMAMSLALPWAGGGFAFAQGPGKPEIGTWGFDVSGMDKSVKPGDDFFSYAGGTWIKNTQIPSDRVTWGSFATLAARVEDQLKVLMDGVVKASHAPGSEGQKLADFYATYLDTAAIEAAGLKPAEADLAAIAAAQSHGDVARLMGLPSAPYGGPMGLFPNLDEKDPNRYNITVFQAGLSLPNRDYYLNTDDKAKDVRAKYLQYIETFLTLAKQPNPADSAKAIVALETAIAQIHWPDEKLRDRNINYNAMTRKELLAFAPDFPWAEHLDAAELGQHDFYVVTSKEAIKALGTLFKQTPVSTWRTYMAYTYLRSRADLLPKALDDANFEFFGKVLQGRKVQRDRWKRALQAVGGVGAAMPDAVGKLYSAKHFPPESRAKVLDLIENLRAAYRVRIEKLDWMSPETKKIAGKKLDTFRLKIGYPDSWVDYGPMTITKGDAFGNARAAAAFEWRRNVKRLNQPTDRDEWFSPPQDVNAYYNPQFNEIVFLAAILQPPFFDPNADPAINYGGIGGVIGHEMGHGYDDQGAKSDENGVLRTWWKKEDEERFKKLAERLIAQYNKFEALPGLFVKGDRTIGENIGDLGGLSVAYEAYRISLKGKEPPILDGFTGDQRFFLGWAQVWRIIMRDELLRLIVLSDEHSPAKFRTNGPVRNMDSWYKAFDVQSTDKLYLKPEERVRIW